MEQRVTIAQGWIEKGLAKRLVLRIARVSPSTYYHHQRSLLKQGQEEIEHKMASGRPVPGYSVTGTGRSVCDAQIQEWLCELVEGDGFPYGYLKLTKSLQRQHGLRINKKKVYRLCRQLNILRPQRRIKPHHPRRLARNQVVIRPNQLWETDIKYGYIAGEDRFFFIQSVLDVYDRSIIDYHIGLSCTAGDAALVLKAALWRRQLCGSAEKPIIRSDNGSQFIAHTFEESCLAMGIEHERIPNRTPNKNAHIESFHRILEEECLSRWEFTSYTEAYEIVADFMIRYNERRLHSSLGYMAPHEFYTACSNNRQQPIKPVRV